MTYSVERAANYVRTDPESEFPVREKQRTAVEAYAAAKDYQLVAHYEDLEVPEALLHHKPALKEAIENTKEEEDWEVLIVAHPRCISDDEMALNELVHKFSLYGNRVECPARSREEMHEAMSFYRREMVRHGIRR
ncbi:MAG: recombinase family protein [Rubrobacter sp.]